MDRLNDILNELGISKVRLAKYLGVSRQMLYNYLAMDSVKDWPKEKSTRLLGLLNIKGEEDLESLPVDSNYIMEVESRLNDGVKDSLDKDILTDLKGFSKKEQELLSDIISLLKEKLADDKSKETFYAYTYLYHYLQSMETSKEEMAIQAFFARADAEHISSNGIK